MTDTIQPGARVRFKTQPQSGPSYSGQGAVVTEVFPWYDGATMVIVRDHGQQRALLLGVDQIEVEDDR